MPIKTVEIFPQKIKKRDSILIHLMQTIIFTPLYFQADSEVKTYIIEETFSVMGPCHARKLHSL